MKKHTKNLRFLIIMPAKNFKINDVVSHLLSYCLLRTQLGKEIRKNFRHIFVSCNNIYCILYKQQNTKIHQAKLTEAKYIAK